MKRKFNARRIRQLKFLIRQTQNWVKTQKMIPIKQRESVLEKIKQLVRELRSSLPSFKLQKALGTITLLAGMTAAQAQISFGPEQVNPFNLNGTTTFTTTSGFGDLDGDGDLDLVISKLDQGTGNTGIHFHENIGSDTNPNYAPAEDMNIITGYYTFPVLVDIDDDGDLDLIGSYDYGIVYYNNDGTPTSPSFGAYQLNPFNLPEVESYVMDFY